MGTADMWKWWKRGRRAALVIAALWCVILGIGVTASLIDRGTLANTGTFTLLGAIGMLVLPGLTAIALRIDAKERRRMATVQDRRALVQTSRTHAHQRSAPGHRARTPNGRNQDRPQTEQSLA
ncbi:MAG: hypothetical protein AB8F26_13560 [Phycisphaerales bacterium]